MIMSANMVEMISTFQSSNQHATCHRPYVYQLEKLGMGGIIKPACVCHIASNLQAATALQSLNLELGPTSGGRMTFGRGVGANSSFPAAAVTCSRLATPTYEPPPLCRFERLRLTFRYCIPKAVRFAILNVFFENLVPSAQATALWRQRG